MSSPSEKINIWVPAVVVALFIGILATAIWDVGRRRVWTFLARFCPCIRREVGLDQAINSVIYLPTRNFLEQRDQVVDRGLEESMRSLIMNGLVRPSDIVQPGGHNRLNEEPARSSNVNTIGPTHDEIIDILETHHDSQERVSLMESTSQHVEDNITFENSDTVVHDIPIRSSDIESNSEYVDATPSTRGYYNEEASNSGSSRVTFNNPLEPDNFPNAHMDSTLSSNSSSSTFSATLYLPGNVLKPFVGRIKEEFHNFACGKIRQWKSSVVLQALLSTHPVVLAKAVKLLKDCVEVDKSCTLQLGTWGILYFKGTSFTNFILTCILLFNL